MPTHVITHDSPNDPVTRKLNAAIGEAAEAGGGRVVVPPGRYTTGTIFLKTNVTLELAAGAHLVASTDMGEYPELPLRPEFPPHLNRGGLPGHRHLFYAEEAENVTIEGQGVIDGNVAAFTPGWEEKQPFAWTGASQRFFVPMLAFLRCRNVRLRDITMCDSPGWTCHLCLCDNVWVQGVQLTNYVFAGNSDGFDVDGCRDVFFHNCRIETGDDAIVLKSFPSTRGCERVIVSNCIMKTLCAGLKIGTESWHDVCDIHFHDSIVYESSRGFQITNLDGACIDGVFVSNLSIDTNCGNLFNRPIHIDVGRRRRSFLPGVTEESRPPAGSVRNVHLSNIHARTDGRILLTAGDGGRLEDVRMQDLSIEHPWVEDPADTLHCDTLQGSVACPRARAACGSVVAENIDRLSLRDLRVQYPRQPPGEGFVPKYDGGKLVRDPRREFKPMPDFEPFIGIDLRDADCG